MSETNSMNRWVPFRCPDCSGIFRVRSQDRGRVGHCPSCRAIVRLDGAGELPERAAALELTKEEAREELLAKVGMAVPKEEDEASVPMERRRRYAGESKAALEWEEEGEVRKKQGSGAGWLWVVAACLAVAIGAGLFLVKGQASDKKVSSKGNAQQFLDEVMKNAGTRGEAVSDFRVEDFYENFDRVAITEVVKGFLTSQTVEERLQWVSDAERVRPLMEQYYGGDAIEAEGFETLDWAQVSYRKGLMVTTVQTGDFSLSPIAILMTEENQFVVDWESWSGYGEKSPEEMKKEKPKEPIMLRVLISPGRHYYYDFKDDKQWRAYRLEFRTSDEVFLGYVRRGSELEGRLPELRNELERSAVRVKVVYPPDAKSGDQVEIVDFVGNGWLDVGDED